MLAVDVIADDEEPYAMTNKIVFFSRCCCCT